MLSLVGERCHDLIELGIGDSIAFAGRTEDVQMLRPCQ